MKEIIEFDPQSIEQVLSMMVAFPEEMADLFSETFKLNQFRRIKGEIPSIEFEHCILQLTEGFIVPES